MPAAPLLSRRCRSHRRLNCYTDVCQPSALSNFVSKCAFLRKEHRKMSSRKWQALLTTVLTRILLIVGALGTATAAPPTEPKKNQIVVPATCTTEDGQSFTTTFVINGMAKTGLLTDSTGNIVITSYTVSYYDDQHNLLDTDKYNTGTKLNSKDDILSCSGQVTTDLEGIGDNVTAFYDFKGFLTTPTR